MRLAGEDSRRGTFSQRHASLVDYATGKTWVPIATLPDKKAKFWVYDSLLSEFAALGFEYGYSVASKDALVAWEAQFGDFMNGAQTIIDQYIVAAEDKWDQTSGLVMLLPHGYEGQGPEHSSARIERFLTLCAEDNVQVVNATTAAQYFHLLRRQMHREVRQPLIEFTPKSYLRRPESRSPVDDLTRGSFQEVLDDPAIEDPAGVQRLVFCSGKVAYDALARRDKTGAAAAVVRIEQLFPFPQEQLLAILAALRERQGARVVAGGAREHGPLAVHVPPSPPDHGVGLLAASRGPGGVGQPGHRVGQDPRAGAAAAARPHLQRIVTPRTCSSSARATSGSSTLIVVMPISRAGLRFTPRSSRKTHSDGSTPSCSQASS